MQSTVDLTGLCTTVIHSLLVTNQYPDPKDKSARVPYEARCAHYIYRIQYVSHSSPDRKQSYGSHGDSSAGASILATAQNNSMYDFLNTLSLYCVGDQQQACQSKNGGVTEGRSSWGCVICCPSVSEETPIPQHLLFSHRGGLSHAAPSSCLPQAASLLPLLPGIVGLLQVSVSP